MTGQTTFKIGQPTARARLEPLVALVRRVDRRDGVLFIVLAAIVAFVGTASAVLIRIVRQHFFGEPGTDLTLNFALVANIALILVGWRHHVRMTRYMTSSRQAEAVARRLAETDPLTGCLNRRSFDAALVRLLATAQADGGDIALMLIDIDRFKLANDIHGHATGDILLIETAQRVRAVLPEHAVLARLGGDEFAVALPASAGCVGDAQGQPPQPEIGDDDHAEVLARRINTAIAAGTRVESMTIAVTASIGLARSDAPVGASPARLARDLLHRADLAMYQAKNDGRDRACWFETGMETATRLRGRLGTAIREALRNREFLPFYEPQVDLASGAVSGFELVARWQSPQFGLITPDVFLPVALDIGVAGELHDSLLGQALRDMRDWAPHLTLSVDIAPSQLRDPSFGQKLLHMLVEEGIPPTRIDLEIPEIILRENFAAVRDLVTDLRSRGMRISLDDFGTGYSSLVYLRSLPFDRIKIDRAFITTLSNNPESSTIVEAISSLARSMDMPITAEGVENAEVLEKLRTFGVPDGQGGLFGQPLGRDDLRRELASHALLADDPNRVTVG